MGELRRFHVPVEVVSSTPPGSTVSATVEQVAAATTVVELPTKKCPECGEVYAAERVDFRPARPRGGRVCVKCWAAAFISKAVSEVVAAVEYDRWMAEANEE